MYQRYEIYFWLAITMAPVLIPMIYLLTLKAN